MIQVEHLSKTFQVSKRKSGFRQAAKAFLSRETTTVHALQDISFTINEGEMVGYIGPNGAGKSTTIKIMCGILTPDQGACHINGRTLGKNVSNMSKTSASSSVSAVNFGGMSPSTTALI